MSNLTSRTSAEHVTFERMRPARRLDQTTHHRPRNTRRDRVTTAARIAAVIGE